MSTPKQLGAYPTAFWTVLDQAQAAELESRPFKMVVPLESRGAGIHLRQKFYAFRQLLRNESHPQAAIASSVTVQVGQEVIDEVPQWVLKFQSIDTSIFNLGLAREWDDAKQAWVPIGAVPEAQTQPELPETPDSVEATTKRILGLG